MDIRSNSKESQKPEDGSRTPGSARQRRKRMGSGPELLSIRGSAADLKAEAEVS